MVESEVNNRPTSPHCSEFNLIYTNPFINKVLRVFLSGTRYSSHKVWLFFYKLNTEFRYRFPKTYFLYYNIIN